MVRIIEHSVCTAHRLLESINTGRSVLGTSSSCFVHASSHAGTESFKEQSECPLFDNFQHERASSRYDSSRVVSHVALLVRIILHRLVQRLDCKIVMLDDQPCLHTTKLTRVRNSSSGLPGRIDQMTKKHPPKISQPLRMSNLLRTLIVHRSHAKAGCETQSPLPIINQTPRKVRLNDNSFLRCFGHFLYVRLENSTRNGSSSISSGFVGRIFSCSPLTVVLFSVRHIGTW